MIMMGDDSRQGVRRVFGLAGVLALASAAQATEPNAQRVNHFVGAAGESIGIQVPPFHGIEPRLGLSYSSEARNGFAGMGWNLGGFSMIERGVGDWGFVENSFKLDGQVLMTCPAGSPYPSCAAGGTHYTNQESYLKIKNTPDVLWEVWGKDGTRTEFTPVYTPPGYTTPFRFGQSKVVDTHGNTVTYTWDVNVGGINGNAYPKKAQYEGTTGNGYKVELFRETRPDPLTGNGFTDISKQTERLKSIVVSLVSGVRIRAYKLGYTASVATGKSLLTSVQTSVSHAC